MTSAECRLSDFFLTAKKESAIPSGLFQETGGPCTAKLTYPESIDRLKPDREGALVWRGQRGMVLTGE